MKIQIRQPRGYIDSYFLCGIIPLASWPTSSMAEQLTLNQQVPSSTLGSVTKRSPVVKNRAF